MNAYTTRGQARIQPRDVSAILHTYPLVSASLAALERQHACQAEAEVTWLLRQNGLTPQPTTAHCSMLRQTIGAALVRAGERLAGVPRSRVLPKAAPAAGTLGTAS